MLHYLFICCFVANTHCTPRRSWHVAFADRHQEGKRQWRAYVTHAGRRGGTMGEEAAITDAEQTHTFIGSRWICLKLGWTAEQLEHSLFSGLSFQFNHLFIFLFDVARFSPKFNGSNQKKLDVSSKKLVQALWKILMFYCNLRRENWGFSTNSGLFTDDRALVSASHWKQATKFCAVPECVSPTQKICIVAITQTVNTWVQASGGGGGNSHATCRIDHFFPLSI